MNNVEEQPITYDITRFTIREVTECGRAVRTMGTGASNMEEAAERIVRYLRNTLIDEQTGEQACTLIRLFKTQSYEGLTEELKGFARNMLGELCPLPEMKCLTLLATAGEKKEWDLKEESRGHRAIPLPCEEVVHQIPMIRNLIKQLGLNITSVLNPDSSLLLDTDQDTFGVFFVPEALGSPYIPAQKEFVIPYKINSVLGFGGILPSLDMFVIIMFLRVPISEETADLFKNLSLNVKLALLPFEKSVFSHSEKLD
jgi:hypothetical protein